MNSAIGDIALSIHHPPEYERDYSDSGIQLIRSQNVRPTGLSLDENPVFFSKTFLDDKKVVFPEIGDVLIVRSGVNAGDVAVIEKKINNAIIGADNLLLKPNDRVVPRFVQVFFFTDIGRSLLNRYLTGATNKHISPYYLASVPIPLISFVDQNTCVEIFEKGLASKIQKETEAQQLLKSIDAYLLGELGIELLEENGNTVEDRMFFRPISEVLGQRYDPVFYRSSYTEIVKSIKTKQHRKLGHIVKFSSELWSQQDLFASTFPYIEIGEIDLAYGEIKRINYVNTENAPSRARMIVRGGDILVSTTRPSRGAIVKVEETDEVFIASTGFAVIREIVDPEVDADFLYFILRHSLSLRQMQQRSSGGNYPAITQEELANIVVPLPPLDKQKEMNDYIFEIRNQAKHLQQQAVVELAQARQAIEAMILGG